MDIINIIDEYVELKYQYDFNKFFVELYNERPDLEIIKKQAKESQTKMDEIKPELDKRYEEYESEIKLLSKEGLSSLCEQLTTKWHNLCERRNFLDDKSVKLYEQGQDLDQKENFELQKIGVTIHTYSSFIFDINQMIGFGTK